MKILFILLTVLGLVQFSFGQGATAKSKAIAQLFNQTGEMFPIDMIEGEIRKQIEANIVNSEKTYLLEPFYEKIDSDTTLTEEKKTELKKKYPEFVKKLSELIRELGFEGFDMQKWYQKSFTANISKNLTSAELKKLNTYFSTPTGKDFVQKFRQISLDGYANVIPQSQNPKLKELIATQNILRKKFIDLLLKDVSNSVKGMVDKWAAESESAERKQKNDQRIERLVMELFEEIK